ncbi:hypothetical protein N7486_010721 [Penicillium sp. IBT 16267x]|nr:hypothetical protein N7486_010721 [Penicillium sp. IBT 16267x]
MTRPAFFCARPGGGLTPMVPLDELPPTISIRGVPRTITPADTQGMTSCGMARARTEPWAIEGASTMAPPNQNDLIELKSILIKMISDNSLPAYHRDLVQNAMSRCLGNVPSAQVTTSATQAVAAPATANQGTHFSGDDRRVLLPRDQDRAQNRKKYCSYWIRHGECDYLQQGCMYKHEMPLEPRLIEELGLRDIPRWYREKFNVPSLLHATYHRPQAQLAIADQPQQKAIEYNEPSTASHDRANNPENAHHRVNNNGRFKAPRGAHNGKGRGNGRNHNSNRNMSHSTNGMRDLHNVPRNMTPEESTSPDSAISRSSSMKTGAPLDIQTSMMNSVSAAPAVMPVTSVAPPAQFGGGNLGFHAYQAPRFVGNDGMLHAAAFSGRHLAKPLVDCFEEGTSSSSVPTLNSPNTPRDSKAPDLFYRQSRRMYDFGCDGDTKKKLGTSPKILTPIEETVESDIVELNVIKPLQFRSGIFEAEIFKPDGRQAVPVLSTMGALLKKLRSGSERIDPHQVLFNFGPIGEDVKLPPKIQCSKTGVLIDTEIMDVTPAPAALPALYTFGQKAMYSHVNN